MVHVHVQIAMADACYANDFSCSLDQLGMREMVEENRRWACLCV